MRESYHRRKDDPEEIRYKDPDKYPKWFLVMISGLLSLFTLSAGALVTLAFQLRDDFHEAQALRDRQMVIISARLARIEAGLELPPWKYDMTAFYAQKDVE